MTAYWKGKTLSEEHRRKLSEAHKGLVRPDETRKRISETMKGRPAHNRGDKMSAETRAKMSAARMGHAVTAETRAKISASREGLHISDEWRANIGKAGKGRVPWNQGIKVGPQSLELRLRHSVAVKGALHYNWKGGITRAQLTIRRSMETREWRKAVFERDDYTCADCKQRGGRLHAHHLKTFAKHPELRFDIPNGVTLCEACHRARHHVRNPNARNAS